jgi:photosystem II stability/assembly factor-like uncharacterized protein
MSTDRVRVYAGTAGHSAWFSADRGQRWLHPNSHSGLYLEARVWCFAADARLPRWMYAGTDEGLYRFDEDTARWSLIESPMRDVWAVAIDPSDPARLICGTRPAAFWVSEDGGTRWQPLAAPGLRTFSEINRGPTRVTQILFDPIDTGTVWASVEIGGIFRSGDAGRTWTLHEDGLISADVHGIAVTRNPSGDKRLLATTNRGLHCSDDDGMHWAFMRLDSPWQYTRAIVALPGSGASEVAGAGALRTLLMTNGDGPPGSTGRLLRSDDGGEHWQPVELPGPLNSTPWCVAADASDPSLLFLCTNLGQLFRSDDGARSWQRLPHEFGEVRALLWRALPEGIGDNAEHSITRRPPPA